MGWRKKAGREQLHHGGLWDGGKRLEESDYITEVCGMEENGWKRATTSR